MIHARRQTLICASGVLVLATAQLWLPRPATSAVPSAWIPSAPSAGSAIPGPCPAEEPAWPELQSDADLQPLRAFCDAAGFQDLPRLQRMVLSPQSVVATQAARALGRLADLDETELLALLADVRPGVRQHFVLGLGESAQPGAVAAMVTILDDECDPELRPLVLFNLGRIGAAAREAIEDFLRRPAITAREASFARAALAAVVRTTSNLRAPTAARLDVDGWTCR